MKKQALKVAKNFKIEATRDNNLNRRATYKWGKKFKYRDDATPYDILHEIGHVLTEYGCCREHDEYIAHGVAIGLSKAFNIDIGDNVYKLIEPYAGRSSHRACGAITKEKTDVGDEETVEKKG